MYCSVKKACKGMAKNYLWPDLEQDVVSKLRDEVESAGHKIVFLNCPPAEAARRCREGESRGKKPWEKNYTERQARAHLQNMIRYLVELERAGFSISCVDSSDFEYKPCQWKEVKSMYFSDHIDD